MKKIILFFLLLLSLGVNAQHLKKDGTPDMRYKENRSSAPSYSGSNSYQSSGQHLKKDGTLDMRYKENRQRYPYTQTNTGVNQFQSSTNNKYTIVKRDAKGKIIRSQAAKNEFKRQSGYPKGRPGYVIDHIKPLKKGGCDCPENMQWQTVAEAKAKDRWE